MQHPAKSHLLYGWLLRFGIQNVNYVLNFVGHKHAKRVNSSSGSSSSTISTKEIQLIVDKLSMERCRNSTLETYHRIWKLFNQFFIKLDEKPDTWEQRLILFTGFLVDNKLKSTTVKTYISAIRTILREVNIKLCENNFLLNSLTRACKLKNDSLTT